MDEEKRKRIMAWKEKEILDKEKREEEEETLREARAEDELMVSEAWRKLKTRGREEREEEISSQEGEKPTKRMRIRERRQAKDLMWGQLSLTEEENGILKWLHEDNQEVDKDQGKNNKQKKLEPWTWLRFEARMVVIEIARKIEETEREEEILLLEVVLEAEKLELEK